MKWAWKLCKLSPQHNAKHIPSTISISKWQMTEAIHHFHTLKNIFRRLRIIPYSTRMFCEKSLMNFIAVPWRSGCEIPKQWQHFRDTHTHTSSIQKCYHSSEWSKSSNAARRIMEAKETRKFFGNVHMIHPEENRNTTKRCLWNNKWCKTMMGMQNEGGLPEKATAVPNQSFTSKSHFSIFFVPPSRSLIH